MLWKGGAHSMNSQRHHSQALDSESNPQPVWMSSADIYWGEIKTIPIKPRRYPKTFYHHYQNWLPRFHAKAWGFTSIDVFFFFLSLKLNLKVWMHVLIPQVSHGMIFLRLRTLGFGASHPLVRLAVDNLGSEDRSLSRQCILRGIFSFSLPGGINIPSACWGKINWKIMLQDITSKFSLHAFSKFWI